MIINVKKSNFYFMKLNIFIKKILYTSAVFFILNKVENKDKKVLKILKKNSYINVGSNKEYTIKQSFVS